MMTECVQEFGKTNVNGINVLKDSALDKFSTALTEQPAAASDSGRQKNWKWK
jgi:hypothetical protein